MSTVRKIKLFWAWRDEQEEEWLREMANQGLHLQRVTFPCYYHFVEGDPADVVYRLDFKTSSQKDMDAYLQIFEDAGWEYAGQFVNGWQYFRKENQQGEEMEIFTDVDSKIAKCRRLIGYLVLFLPILVTSLNNIGKAGWNWLGLITLIVLVLYIIAFFKLFQRIERLKKRP